MIDYPQIQQFRIWNPETKKFIYSGGTPTMLSDFFRNTAAFYSVYSLQYQRNTFLKDRCGKEIYEGDIIKWGVYIGNVRWKVNFYVFTFNDFGISPCNQTAEIIGNIYETPELLEPSHDPRR